MSRMCRNGLQQPCGRRIWSDVLFVLCFSFVGGRVLCVSLSQLRRDLGECALRRPVVSFLMGYFCDREGHVSCTSKTYLLVLQINKHRFFNHRLNKLNNTSMLLVGSLSAQSILQSTLHGPRVDYSPDELVRRDSLKF